VSPAGPGPATDAPYGAFAAVYDRWTADNDFDHWAADLDRRLGDRVDLVHADLAAPGAAAVPGFGAFDAAICTFDSVNYFDDGGVAALHAVVGEALRPGAPFVFDVNLAAKLGGVFADSHYGVEACGLGGRMSYFEYEKSFTNPYRYRSYPGEHQARLPSPPGMRDPRPPAGQRRRGGRVATGPDGVEVSAG
jgi:hypothetical protein